jgi:hypothetical protein
MYGRLLRSWPFVYTASTGYVSGLQVHGTHVTDLSGLAACPSLAQLSFIKTGLKARAVQLGTLRCFRDAYAACNAV